MAESIWPNPKDAVIQETPLYEIGNELKSVVDRAEFKYKEQVAQGEKEHVYFRTAIKQMMDTYLQIKKMNDRDIRHQLSEVQYIKREFIHINKTLNESKEITESKSSKGENKPLVHAVNNDLHCTEKKLKLLLKSARRFDLASSENKFAEKDCQFLVSLFSNYCDSLSRQFELERNFALTPDIFPQQVFINIEDQFGPVEVRDCTFTPCGDRIFCDKMNKRLLVYDCHNTFKQSIGLDDEPFSVASIDDTKLAISFPDSSRVIIFDITTKEKNKVFSFENHCLGISIQNDVLAVYVEEFGFHIIDLKKYKRVKMIEIHEDNSSYVALCDERLYYSNWKTDKVICMTLEGHVLWEFKNEILKKPNGVATDSHGNVFVCGYSSGCIVSISRDGLISNQIATPSSQNELVEAKNTLQKSMKIVNPIGIDIKSVDEVLICSNTAFNLSFIEQL